MPSNATGPGEVSPSEDHLVLAEEFPHCRTVYFEPSPDMIDAYGKQYDAAQLDLGHPLKLRRKLLFFNGDKDYLSIFPIRTYPESVDFLEPKYRQIATILLEGFGFGTPETTDEVKAALEELPTGLVKNHQYGLGLLKECRFIIDAIQKLREVTQLVISMKRDTKISKHSYILSFDDFDSIRRAINRITTAVRAVGTKDKAILAHNSLLSSIDPDLYPELTRPYKRDTIFKIVSGNAAGSTRWSDADRKAAVTLVANDAAAIARKNPDDLMQLRNEIELVTLGELIQKFDEMLGMNLPEGRWQRLFSRNPFILGLVFGFPIVKINDQASVGGRTIAGTGDKITDFLVKNNLTDNTALIEIKTPGTKLLGKEYRDGVHAPTTEFAGSINQMLDQKYKFQKEIASLKENSGLSDLESYAVNCVLIIGMTPNDRSQRKSFELFRNNSREISVITFDELLEKLKSLRSFLSLASNQKREGSQVPHFSLPREKVGLRCERRPRFRRRPKMQTAPGIPRPSREPVAGTPSRYQINYRSILAANQVTLRRAAPHQRTLHLSLRDIPSRGRNGPGGIRTLT